ncbi:MAG: FAD-dependent oxidoreductase [Kangiellaceae bacterium]|nr:FAD-dependent oxidoreductase [Kangiellaceae bacterium]
MSDLQDASKPKQESKIKIGPLNFLELDRATPVKRTAKNRKIDFKEIYDNAKDVQLSNQAARCLDCGNPYCEWKCPLHNYIPNWLDLVANENYQQAGELMYETNPLPEICGRICPQDRLCEQACTINTGFGAVTIGAIEKNVTDKLMAKQWRPDLSQIIQSDKKVAVVGAGPAGLACADQLARNGIKVTVHDLYPEIGGLLTFGIPGFKLEKEVLVNRRKFLEDIGVQFKLNTMISDNSDVTPVQADRTQSISITELNREYDSVFLAMGTYTSVQSHLSGSDAKGVIKALDYLIGNVNKIEKYKMTEFIYHNVKDKNVIVIGGGDTAMDCVRTAIRQGAKSVSCVYRRDEVSMPGSPSEVKNAKDEGVNFLFNLSPASIKMDNAGQVIGLTTFETKQIADTKTGKSKLHIDETSEQLLHVDIIITAFGFKASPADWFEKSNIATKENGLVKTVSMEDQTDTPPFSQQTSNSKIFAGGDMVRGADLVVTAIADGIKAANEIIEQLTAKSS